ncbi:callose synthase 5 [Cajanus cajan]|uniref:callose synthase 5 n=1 Tax=Cajanus cajan TaxID=3821 RepID=UPI00098D93A4|nr:callose synthase 5 [Cajanus cajan]
MGTPDLACENQPHVKNKQGDIRGTTKSSKQTLPTSAAWATRSAACVAASGAFPAYKKLPQIKAAVSALWNTRGLNWPSSVEQHRHKTGDLDMLDWLKAMFGFQRDNVRNQREHLILLLANSHIRSTYKRVEEREKVAPEIIAAARDVQAKTEIYTPYNILPLDAAGASVPIMQFEEIKAAVSALWNTRGLNWPSSVEQHRHKTGDLDMLDWLKAMFGFQRDNVRNQREHLILLLANSHIRLHPKPEPFNLLDDRAVDSVMKNLFKNYKTWCKFLGRKHSLRLPQGQQEIQQRKLLYMGLYLLIWGEAANVRFMPECLCYIFHNMAYELHGLLAGNVSIVTGENIKPSYGGDDEAFLLKVITPLYRVIEKEAKKSRHGKAPHSAWCNYDDLNEYFWSSECFSLGWPMRDDGEFFKSTSDLTQGRKGAPRQSGKTCKSNFVETRSFWHTFHSFDRMWTFFLLGLQVMFIMAWEGILLSDIFQKDVLYNLSSIFITASILRLLQSMICSLKLLLFM